MERTPDDQCLTAGAEPGHACLPARHDLDHGHGNPDPATDDRRRLAGVTMAAGQQWTIVLTG